MMASVEAHGRGIPLGPVAPKSKWESLDRHVLPEYEGKGLHCWLPIPRYEKNEETGKREVMKDVRPGFKLVPYWYTLSMTDGPDMPPLEVAGWDGALALKTLGIEREDFRLTDGNTGGYAYAQTVAVNPVTKHAVRVLCHEMAHVMLGHTKDARCEDGEKLSRGEQEAEAEAVAMLVVATLGEKGEEESRGYVQHWLEGAPLRPKLARRIMRTAKKVLDAGYAEEK
jgi:hypothetical protein